MRHGAVRLQAACSEPGDVGADRDLDDGVAGALVLPMRAAAEHVGQGLITGGGGSSTPPQSAGPLARAVSFAVIRVTHRRERPSMAQLRWQKPANGSDMLAIAQIRWQRTLTS